MKTKIIGIVLLFALWVIRANSQTLTCTVTATPATSCSACNGSASASVSGGYPPYTYYWINSGSHTSSANGLCAGGYYALFVYDTHGDTAIGSGEFAVGPQPVSFDSVNSTPAGCTSSLGSAWISGLQGTAPYTYLWEPGGQTSDSATGLSAGTYSVTVTGSSGCSASNTVTVHSGLEPVVSTTNSTGCADNGSATVTNVNGGMAPYTYSWSEDNTSNPGVLGTNQTVSGLSAGYYNVVVTDNNGCSGTSYGVSIYRPNPINVADSVITGASCSANTGSVVAWVYGGTRPYTYFWNSSPTQTTDTATGLSGGYYTVTITDNGGCATTAQVYIPLTGPNATIATTYACIGSSNGTATVTSVSGGVSPYTYDWYPSNSTGASINGLSTGTYSLSVTDNNGCNGINSFTIYQDNIDANNSSYSSSSTCGLADGSAYVVVYNGNYPYTYLWEPGSQTNDSATGLLAGTYTLTITDAGGCSATNAVVVSAGGPAVTIATTNPTCSNSSNGSATVTSVSGTAPYTYLWLSSNNNTNSSISGLSAGADSVVVTTSTGCTDTNVVYIYPRFAMTVGMVVGIDTTNTSACNYIIAVGVVGGIGAAPYTYSWSGNPHISSSGVDSSGIGGYEYVDSLCYGASYTVCVTNAFGCMVCDSISTVLTGVTSIKENAGAIKIYPNPASDKLFVATDGLSSGEYTLYVYDMMGRQIQANNVNLTPGETVPVNIAGLPTGEYMLRISGENASKTAPFIISH